MQNQIDRKKAAYLEAWVSIVGNVLIFAVRLVFGMIINSIAVIADSMHTLSDVITSVIVIFGFKASSKPPDKQHPFGHGRSEFVATLIIAVILLVVAIEIGKNAFWRLFNPPEVKGSWLVFFIILFTAALKEWMARFAFNIGKNIKSDTLKADAWHHRSDALISLIVAAGIIATMFGFFSVDAIMGMVVAIAIAWVGFSLTKQASSSLIGEAPKEELEETIIKLSKDIAGVKGVHDIWIHNYGDRNSISLHIEVDKNLSLNEAHKIADKVEREIFANTNSPTVAHVDLISKGRVSE